VCLRMLRKVENNVVFIPGGDGCFKSVEEREEASESSSVLLTWTFAGLRCCVSGTNIMHTELRINTARPIDIGIHGSRIISAEATKRATIPATREPHSSRKKWLALLAC
jgi:hypothetical protein